MNKKFLLPLTILISSVIYAQHPIAVGTWQTHFNYSAGKDVELIGNTLFYITENTILKLDLKENALLHLDKTNGLSDVGINCTSADSANAALIIAYNNGLLEKEYLRAIDNYNKMTDEEFFADVE